MIYRAALVKRPRTSDERGEWMVRSLVPPSLLRSSSRLRAEAMSIYYGENEFWISAPVIRAQWLDFFNMCTAMAASGGLRFIRYLEFQYEEPLPELSDGCVVGFVLQDQRPEGSEDAYRIGNDQTDWNNEADVGSLFYETLEYVLGSDTIAEMQVDCVPIKFIQRTFGMLARSCAEATRHAEVQW